MFAMSQKRKVKVTKEGGRCKRSWTACRCEGLLKLCGDVRV